MPVRLDLHPPKAPRPAPARLWFWLGLLLMFLLVGAGWVVFFLIPAQRHNALDLWEMGMGVPLLVWSVLAFARALTYIGQQQAAQGWDQAREEALSRKTRYGRRSLQVLGTSFNSALRAPGKLGAEQLGALLDGSEALKAQRPEGHETPVRHSRLANSTHEAPEEGVLSTLQEVLSELSQTLEALPLNTPLAVLLEVESGVPQQLLRRVWREAWNASGIRQPTVSVEGNGLAAVDLWLDQRINDQAVLMVIALRFTPPQPETTAEVAVGMLLGNHLTQTTLAPVAYLHRPEQSRQSASEPLLYAARQALDWVPLPASGIEQVWQSGLDPAHGATISTVLKTLSMPVKRDHDFIDLDARLGHAGQASPWLAIAVAALTIEHGGGPQFIFSGGSSAGAGLWSTVLMPASALSR